jgi:hypothetical protein
MDLKLAVVTFFRSCSNGITRSTKIHDDQR